MSFPLLPNLLFAGLDKLEVADWIALAVPTISIFAGFFYGTFQYFDNQIDKLSKTFERQLYDIESDLTKDIQLLLDQASAKIQLNEVKENNALWLQINSALADTKILKSNVIQLSKSTRYSLNCIRSYLKDVVKSLPESSPAKSIESDCLDSLSDKFPQSNYDEI